MTFCYVTIDSGSYTIDTGSNPNSPQITFRPKEGLPQQNPKSKSLSEWSPLLDRRTAIGRTMLGNLTYFRRTSSISIISIYQEEDLIHALTLSTSRHVFLFKSPTPYANFMLCSSVLDSIKSCFMFVCPVLPKSKLRVIQFEY